MLCAISSLAAGQEKTTAGITDLDNIDCTGTAKACIKPVRFLSKTPSCVCFTCGYGTPDSRQICTKNRSEAKRLASSARHSGYKDQYMDNAVGALGTTRWSEAAKSNDKEDAKSKDKQEH